MSKEDYCDCNECRLHRTRVIPVLDDKPTMQEFILSELRDLNGSLSQLRLEMGDLRRDVGHMEAHWRGARVNFNLIQERLEKIEQDCRYVEVEGLKTVPRDIAAVLEEMDRVAEASRRGNETFTGSIDGLPGVFTVTAPGWEGAE